MRMTGGCVTFQSGPMLSFGKVFDSLGNFVKLSNVLLVKITRFCVGGSNFLVK